LDAARAPSNIAVTHSSDPPPPPPPPPLELLLLAPPLELLLDGGGGAGEPGVTPETNGEAQGPAPAVAGASVDALEEVMTTSAVSARPELSVTVSRSAIEPEPGAAMLALALFAPVTAGGFAAGAMTDHAWEARVRPQAAALPEPSRATVWPAETLAGRSMAAIGRSAASTELAAFTMPEPQVVVVQRHCASCTSWEFAGT
jgi:hypothetical protein